MTDYSKIEKYVRHGGAYDRGEADSYYRRRRNPHYFVGHSFLSTEVTEKDMTPEEIAAYNQGYDDNEELGDYKQYD